MTAPSLSAVGDMPSKNVPGQFEDPLENVVRRIGKMLAGDTAETARAARFHTQEGRSELGDVGKVLGALRETVAHPLILCVLGLERPDEGGAIDIYVFARGRGLAPTPTPRT